MLEYVDFYNQEYNYLSLPYLLNNFTIPQLKEMAITLGFRIKGKGNKASLVTCIADTLLKSPELIVKAAYAHELKAWLDIIEGSMSMEQAEAAGYLFDMNRFGFIYSFDRNVSNIFFQHDLAEKLEPLIPDELERREKDGSLILEKLCLGLANLYGYTEDAYIQQYFPEVEKLLGRKLDYVFLTAALLPVLADTRYGLGQKLERPLVSPFAPFIGYDIENDIDYQVEAKEFDIETILNFGEMPYPVFNGKYADGLKEVIAQYGAPECNADYIMRKMWLDHLNKNAKPIPNLDFLRLPDFSKIQSCLSAVMDFQNNVPFWKFRGNSSAERAKSLADNRAKEEVPQIVLGPNTRAMGLESFDQILEMARRGEEFPPMPSNPVSYYTKVGRNDPCPCGSGKKYKHCCGR